MIYSTEILGSGAFIPILQPKYQMIKMRMPNGFINLHLLAKRGISVVKAPPSVSKARFIVNEGSIVKLNLAGLYAILEDLEPYSLHGATSIPS